VSTVAPRVAFDAVFTSEDTPSLGAAVVVPATLEGAAAVAEEEEADPLELLPQAARITDAKTAGTRIFRVGRIGTPWATLRIRIWRLEARHCA
jgi:hypothetical protein